MADFGTTLVSDGLFSVTWPEFLDDPAFQFEQSLADNADDTAESLAGLVGFILSDPLAMGPGTKIGTFAFPANSLTGSGVIELDSSSVFFDSAGTQIPDVELIGTLATVPLPSAAWLLISALVLLAVASRARKPVPAMPVAAV